MSRPKLVVYGNGHMARTVHQFARLEFDVVGFTVDRSCIEGRDFDGLPLCAFDEVESLFPPSEHRMLIAVGFIEMNALRRRKYEEAKSKGYSFANLIHSSVLRHDSLEIGDNNIILDHVSVHPYTSIGNSNFISSNTNIGHGCRIGNGCWINAGVSIAGEVTVGDNCFFGMNAACGNDLVIAEGCYVGATALIARDTEPRRVYLAPSAEVHRLESDAFLRFAGLS